MAKHYIIEHYEEQGKKLRKKKTQWVTVLPSARGFFDETTAKRLKELSEEERTLIKSSSPQ